MELKYYLHYYINGKQPIIVTHEDYEGSQFMLAGIDHFTETVIMTDMDGGINQDTPFDEIHKLKPILRRIEDVSYEEMKTINSLMENQSDGVHATYITVHTFKSFHYMLSIGIDLFDLIPNNLAIDKNKMV